MMAGGMEQNHWKIQPDNTVQVVEPMGMDEDDGQSRRNWRGIFISLSIIAFVLLMVAVATIVLGEPPPPFYGRRLIINDLEDPTLIASPMGTQWVSSNKLAYQSEDEGIRLLNTDTGENVTLVTNIALHQTGAEEFYVSPNLRYVLLVHNVIKGRLYTRTAEFSIYDVNTNHYYPLKIFGDEVGQPRYKHASWIGEESALVVINAETNIFYLPSPSADPYPLTNDAKPNILWNGVPDLLYEEILAQGHAVWSSPGGKYIAAASFNDSGVRELPVLEYSENIYPTVHILRYPTVSTQIPEVAIWIYDMQNPEALPHRTKLIPPEPMSRSHYMVNVGWVNDTTVWASWASRDQSIAILATCEAPSWDCSLVHVNHRRGGVSPVIRSVVFAGGWAMFPWSVRTLSGSWHNHVALVGAREGRHAPLTLEEYHVTKILGFDVASNIVFFKGSELVNGAGRQQLYSVSIITENVKCISCRLGCPFVRVSINPKVHDFAVVSCIGPKPPSTHLVPLYEHLNDTMVVLHDQYKLRENLGELALGEVVSLDLALSPTLHAAVTLTLPPGWTQEDDTLLYPLVVQMIGPGEQDVDEPNWHLGFRQYLASGHQVAHAKVLLWGSDPSTRASVHTLAQYHTRVIRKMLEEFNYLDPKNVGLWGWGSGASLALDAAALAPELLKCVAAVNPVVDWKAHGSFWAERLLGATDSTDAGRRYEDSDLTRLALRLQRTKVLLAHGTRDPAAHHAFLLAHALIKEETYFTHVVFPDVDYSLLTVRHQLETLLEEFIFSQGCIPDPLQKKSTSL